MLNNEKGTTKKSKSKKGKCHPDRLKEFVIVGDIFFSGHITANGSRRKLSRVVGVNKKVEEEKELNKPTNWSGTWLGI